MKKVLVFITDGYADWEASYICAELNNPGTGYEVRTVAIDKAPKVSMGGFRVLPDYDVHDESFLADMAMLIIPGGTGWSEEKNRQAVPLVRYCEANGIPVGAICDATTFLGRHGFLDSRKHTGNTLGHLKAGAPDYKGDAHYVNAQSVRDGGWITANGSGALEFSRHILEELGVLEGEKLEEWYAVFKKGYLPE